MLYKTQSVSTCMKPGAGKCSARSAAPVYTLQPLLYCNPKKLLFAKTVNTKIKASELHSGWLCCKQLSRGIVLSTQHKENKEKKSATNLRERLHAKGSKAEVVPSGLSETRSHFFL